MFVRVFYGQKQYSVIVQLNDINVSVTIIVFHFACLVAYNVDLLTSVRKIQNRNNSYPTERIAVNTYIIDRSV